MKQIMLFFLIIAATIAQAQVLDAPPLDGAWKKENIENSQPVPYIHIRQADVLWSKRVWRVIDMREKMNQPLYYPVVPTAGRISLMTVVFNALKDGKIKAYSADDFKQVLNYDEIMKSLEKRDSTVAFREYPPYEQYDTVIVQPFDPGTVMMFRLKEDWFVDKQRSVMDVRILGICPLRANYSSSGELRGYMPMFWIYFSELRPMLANNEIFNRQNDAARTSYDDFFFKRMFSSYIIKESNVYDRTISEYALGLDGLLESDKIKESIFNVEHDMWEY